MPDAVIHPTAQQLAAFGLGKLPDQTSANVASHLEGCPACRQAVASLPPDSFLGKVRAARPGASAMPAAGAAPRPSDATSLPSRPAASAPLPNLPPELANQAKFRIVRELGRGGMGVIYLAEHRVMEKPVALKVISPAVLDNPDALARFHGEARAAGKLDHQNIARAYDADQAGNLHFLVMEFVEGMTLAQVVEQKGPLPIAHACHYTRQAALGLHHAFEQGMVHRDVKPQNLMLTPRGLVKVLDFGLARLRCERAAGGGLTQVDAFMGTPEYVSPEQATDARSADTRADIYSLGCTLYALLTGRPPFQEDTAVKLVLAHIEKEPRPLHEVRPDVPAELSAVLARMLAKDPAQRYQSPIEVAQALVPFIKPGAQPRASGSAALPEGVASPGRGTIAGGDTSKLKGLDKGAGKEAAMGPVAGGQKESPFGDLVEAAAPAPKPKKAKKEREAAKPGPVAWYRRWQVIVGGAVAGVLLFGLVVFITVPTKEGTLIVEINDKDVEARIKNGKLILTGPDGKTQYTLAPSDRNKKWKAGPYQIRVEGADGLVLDTPEFILKKGDTVTVRVTMRPPAVPKATPPITKTENALLKIAQPPRPSAALDALRRDRIAPEALAAAGDGDPKRAPASLVGVLGEAQPIQTGALLGLAYSPDGRWLATGSVDKTIMLRDAATGEVKRTLKGHTGAVSAVVFSKDSKTLVSSSHDRTVKLWPVEKEEEPKTVQAELGPIVTMAASPDGRFLAAGGVDRPVKLWKWGQWDKPSDLSAHKGRVTSLTFSPNGATLASSWDGSVRIYQTSDGKLTQTWPADGSNRVLAFHRDGKRLVSTGGLIKIWDVASGKQLAQSRPGAEPLEYSTLALHPDGRIMYACNGGGLLGQILELATFNYPSEGGKRAFREPVGICSAAYSPNGKLLAFGTNNGSVHVWDFSQGKKQHPSQGHSHYIHTLAASPGGRTVLSGGDDSSVRQWDVASPKRGELMLYEDQVLHQVVYSHDGKKFATSASFIFYDFGRRGIAWDATTGKQLFVVDPLFNGHSVVFSPDRKSLAGCEQGGAACIIFWDADTGKQLHRFPKMGVCLDRPAFSRTGKLVAAATTDTKCAKVWDVKSGEEVASWTDPKPMCTVALSPDGRLLAAGHHDGAISLWEVAEKGKKKRIWEGHSGPITRLMFVPDGKTLVSSGSDGTIRLWNPEAARAREIITLGPAKRPLTFDLDPSGKYLFAAGHSPLIYVLRLP